MRVCNDMVRHSMAWYGMVWYGMVCYGMLCYVTHTQIHQFSHSSNRAILRLWCKTWWHQPGRTEAWRGAAWEKWVISPPEHGHMVDLTMKHEDLCRNILQSKQFWWHPGFHSFWPDQMDISSTNDGDENHEYHEYHEGIASSAIKNMGIFVSRGCWKPWNTMGI